MQNLNEIKDTINKHRTTLIEEFKISSLSLFGSYVRDEQPPQSDLDILVEFYEIIDLFEFIRLENFLSEILNCKVDLVMKDTLKPRIKESILNQAVEL
jgi:hypothetical protein